MPSAQKTSLIHEYSNAFTSLISGKRELIQWGADKVALNRYVVEAAGSTAVVDVSAVLKGIDPNKVPHGTTEQERNEHCALALKELVTLQEEVSLLQKAAREDGISGGLLTIVGQAASQSPDDNGASVLRHLSELVDEENAGESANADSATADSATIDNPAEDAPSVSSVQLLDADELTETVPTEKLNGEFHQAANDTDRLDHERLTTLQQLGVAVREHWRPLLVDASVCVVATGIAISLVN